MNALTRLLAAAIPIALATIFMDVSASAQEK